MRFCGLTECGWRYSASSQVEVLNIKCLLLTVDKLFHCTVPIYSHKNYGFMWCGKDEILVFWDVIRNFNSSLDWESGLRWNQSETLQILTCTKTLMWCNESCRCIYSPSVLQWATETQSNIFHPLLSFIVHTSTSSSFMCQSFIWEKISLLSVYCCIVII